MINQMKTTPCPRLVPWLYLTSASQGNVAVFQSSSHFLVCQLVLRRIPIHIVRTELGQDVPGR